MCVKHIPKRTSNTLSLNATLTYEGPTFTVFLLTVLRDIESSTCYLVLHVSKLKNVNPDYNQIIVDF